MDLEVVFGVISIDKNHGLENILVDYLKDLNTNFKGNITIQINDEKVSKKEIAGTSIFFFSIFCISFFINTLNIFFKLSKNCFVYRKWRLTKIYKKKRTT